jgi:DNA polymerase (family 10)
VPATNEQLARMLDAKADELGAEGANPYRVRAYRRAARGVEGFGKPVEALVKQGADLRQIPGVGEGIAATLKALVEGGPLPEPKRPRPAPEPQAAKDLRRVEALGPKRAKQLVEAGIADLASLEKAAREGKLRGMPGFGESLERRILEALSRRTKDEDVRRIRPLLASLVHKLQDAVAAAPGIERVEPAGSYRRKKDTIGDLDLVAAGDHAAAAKALEGHPEAAHVIASGPAKTSVRLSKGLQVDLRCVPPESFGAALVYFTGSKDHNVALRALAKKKGLTLNEYGLFEGKKQVAGRTEAEVYGALGLPFIEPELREDRGEVEAALKGKLPKLVTLADLKGDLHTHTDWTDGHSTLEGMAKAAARRGLKYIAVTDHTPRTAIAGGMKWERHLEQHKEIDALNKRFEAAGKDFRLLKGAEVDILKDGTLDLPAKALESLDVVVASLHFRERHTPKELTERVLKAMGTGRADILGHPSGRMMPKRPPMEHDWARLIDAAKDQGWAFEADGQPWRQDAWDTLLHHCKKAGVRIATDSDAHSTGELAYIEFAVDQARRGWAETGDVLNTRSAKDLVKLLRKNRA